MLQLTSQEQKTIIQKWAIPIMFVLYNEQKFSYNKLRGMLDIPNSTLSLRLNELIKYKFIEKFIYGNPRGPHYTDYQISDFGLKYINNLISNNI